MYLSLMLEKVKPSILATIETTKKWLRNFENFREIADFDEIARRSFVNNAFDGSMTMLGIVAGVFLSNITDYRVIISSGLGASIAMGVSGASGAYMAENAERTKDLRDLEDAMLTNLENSIIHKASRFAAIYIAFIDGISPTVTALISLTPFFLVRIGILGFGTAIKASVALTFLTIFMIGVFLGKVSGENVLKKGMLMTAAGVVTVLLTAMISLIF